jgi:hypothetical protein
MMSSYSLLILLLVYPVQQMLFCNSVNPPRYNHHTIITWDHNNRHFELWIALKKISVNITLIILP